MTDQVVASDRFCRNYEYMEQIFSPFSTRKYKKLMLEQIIGTPAFDFKEKNFSQLQEEKEALAKEVDHSQQTFDEKMKDLRRRFQEFRETMDGIQHASSLEVKFYQIHVIRIWNHLDKKPKLFQNYIIPTVEWKKCPF
jgi:hypothetical protein